MFYYLLLAHLIADYPLQSTWMVINKYRWEVVILHASLQFLTSLILVWLFSSSFAATIWPYLIMLALFHLLIDSIKNALIRYRPTWVKVSYLFDQLVHILSLLILSLIIEFQYGISAFPSNPGWVVLAIAYLFVTYVWYISEKVMTFDDPLYQQAVIRDSIPRMLFRTVFLSGFLGIWVGTMKSLPTLSLTLFYPYHAKQFGRRALFTDLGVTVGVFLFIVFVLNPSF